MNLHVVSETDTTVTLGWEPVADAVGYRFQSSAQAPRWSHTWDPARRTVKFAKGQEPYRVEALGLLDAGVWPGATLSWESMVAAVPEPQFTAGRIVHCSSRAELDLALASMQAGDDIAVDPFVTTSPLRLVDRPRGRITFAPGFAVIVNGENDDALTVARSALILRGGAFSALGSHGRGILLHDSPVDHRGFLVHDAAFTGVFSSAISRDVSGQVLVGKVRNCGYDATYDPHAEKGTGVHGVYVGATATEPSPFKHVGCVWAFDVVTQPMGNAVQCGGYVRDCVFVIRARDLRFNAQRQIAGNGLAPWGQLDNVTVRWLEVEDASGRACDPNGLWAGSVTVEHGRARNTNQNPLLDRQPYKPSPYVSYRDCL